jgi:EAL and modified HD-GYP domain-containing signal transduction protein
MTKTDIADEKQVSVSIARQPIFDKNRRLWGYELFCVGSAGASFGPPEEDAVAVSVASSAYIGLQQIVEQGKKVIVHFSETSILDNLPYALPAALAAISVNEEIYAWATIPESLQKMKSDGYQIVVSAFSGNSMYDPLYLLADIISIDVADRPKEAQAAALSKAQTYSALLMASHVKDLAHFERCRELGFSLFHGPFFKSPDKVTIRKLTSNEVSRFNLFRMIQQDEPDFDQMAETIQSDVVISFRLLAYLNSAAFGFPQKIKSINQALSLLGWQKMKNWLRVVLLTDMSRNKNAPELVMLASQRGHLLERIARDHDFWGFDPESLQLLGMFSLLDAMLGIPMAEVITYLPLDDKLKSALCGEPNNEYLPLLQLAQYLEEARWDDVEKLIQRLNLDRIKVKAAFQASIDWAGSLTALHE